MRRFQNIQREKCHMHFQNLHFLTYNILCEGNKPVRYTFYIIYIIVYYSHKIKIIESCFAHYVKTDIMITFLETIFNPQL